MLELNLQESWLRLNSQHSQYQQYNKGNYSNKPKKERPQSSHCCLLGHVVDKCWKIHGNPLGYMTKDKSQWWQTKLL